MNKSNWRILGNNLILIMFNVLLKTFNRVTYDILFLTYRAKSLLHRVCKSLSIFFVQKLMVN